jgi:membrane-associated protein
MDFLWQLVDQFGYVSMFLFSWIILLGFPVPNEVAAALTGYLVERRGFNPYLSFFSMYAGLISYGLFGFGIGRVFGTKILYRFFHHKRVNNIVHKGESWIAKFGPLAISFSYFIPGVRLFLPYVAGASMKIPLWKFILFGFPAAFLWGLLYFQIGRLFPSSFLPILEGMSWKLAIVFGVLFILLAIYHIHKRKSTSIKRRKIRLRK